MKQRGITVAAATVYIGKQEVNRDIVRRELFGLVSGTMIRPDVFTNNKESLIVQNVLIQGLEALCWLFKCQ